MIVDILKQSNSQKEKSEHSLEKAKNCAYTEIALDNTLFKTHITEDGILIPTAIATVDKGSSNVSRIEMVYYNLKKETLVNAFKSWGYNLDKIKDEKKPQFNILNPEITIKFLGRFNNFPVNAVAGNAIVHDEVVYIYDGESWRNINEFF